MKLPPTATPASDFLAGLTDGPVAEAVKVAWPDWFRVTLVGLNVMPEIAGAVTVTAPAKPAAKGTLMTICAGCPGATATGVDGPVTSPTGESRLMNRVVVVGDPP